MKIEKDNILFLVRSYNEWNYLLTTIDNIKSEWFNKILVVDDGSSDWTENKIIQKVNNLFVYQSVKLTEKEREIKDSINFIENKLFDIIK